MITVDLGPAVAIAPGADPAEVTGRLVGEIRQLVDRVSPASVRWAESIAYAVCADLGIDSSQYSFEHGRKMIARAFPLW